MPIQRIPLATDLTTRDGTLTKDSRTVNAVFENDGQELMFVKRPGLSFVNQFAPTTPPTSLHGQGLFGFNGLILAAINNTLYSWNPSTNTQATIGTFTGAAATKMYGEAATLDSKILLQNLTSAYIYTSAGSFSTLSNQSVLSVTMTSGGTGYTYGSTVTFSSPGGSGTTATGIVLTAVGTGSVTGVYITNPGSGYGSPPTITFTAASPVSYTATGLISSDQVTINSYSGGIYGGMTVTGTGIAPNSVVIGYETVGTTYIAILNNTTTGVVSGTVTFTDLGVNAVATAVLNQFPTETLVPGVVFLDNYFFVGGATSNNIYCSFNGDPASWNALCTVNFYQTDDYLVGITRHLNYLVAFGKKSIQFFYDTGTGTNTLNPLAPIPSYSLEIGCINADSIASQDNTTIWVGYSKTQGKGVYLLDGVSPVKVSTSSIDKILDSSSYSKVTSYLYKFWGHGVYVLTLHDLSLTLVYDTSTKMWSQWTQYAQSYDSNPGQYFESYFRGTLCAEINNQLFVLDDDSATLYNLNNNIYQDVGQPIYCRSVTELHDFGSTKQKFFGRSEIVGDKYAPPGVNYGQLSYTSNDYVSFSTPRQIDLGAPRSQIYQCANDRRRAWQFVCTDNLPIRLECLEIDYRQGEVNEEQ